MECSGRQGNKESITVSRHAQTKHSWLLEINKRARVQLPSKTSPWIRVRSMRPTQMVLYPLFRQCREGQQDLWNSTTVGTAASQQWWRNSNGNHSRIEEREIVLRCSTKQLWTRSNSNWRALTPATFNSTMSRSLLSLYWATFKFWHIAI